MGYKRKPNYHFATKLEAGLDSVPVGRMVVCEDYDGFIKVFVYDNATNVTPTTTIEQAVGASNLIIDKTIQDALDSKQASLVSGTNIKTVNGSSVLGAGDLDVSSAYDVAKSLTTNGYQKLSNGLILQWGYDATGATGTYTFPIAFPNAALNIIATEYNYGTNGSEKITITNLGVASFDVTRNATSGAFWYFAIGH